MRKLLMNLTNGPNHNVLSGRAYTQIKMPTNPMNRALKIPMMHTIPPGLQVDRMVALIVRRV